MDKVTSDGWEPDALTAQVRFWEGSAYNRTRIEYCDTTSGNAWQTVNTNPILHSKDSVLLTVRTGNSLTTNGWDSRLGSR